MDQNGQTVLLCVIGYLAGSVPFGKLAGWSVGIDIQKKGSGNIGFANVVRVLGWRYGLPVLALDTAKGFLPVWVARHYLGPHGLMVVGLAALAGHIYPIWLRFKGGKGIATGLGVTLAINAAIGLGGALAYAAAFSIFKKSAMASLVAAISLPLLFLIFDKKYFWFYVFRAALAFYTHRSNIQQFRKGTIHGAA